MAAKNLELLADKKINYLLKTLLILLVIITTYCNKAEKKATYEKLEIRDKKILQISEEIPLINDLAKLKENIFIISKNDVWVVDLNSKKETILIKEGIGPDEIYKASRIIRFNDELYLNSYYQLNYIYHLSPHPDKYELNRIYFDLPLDFDDFDFISDSLMVMVNVYWETGFIRFYNFKSKNTLKIGKGEISELMTRFNVNWASLCLLGDKIYVVQATKPEIMVISGKEKKISNTIKLYPPFFKPIPGKYKVQNYDDKNHKKWMASWTSIYDILGKGDWLLVIYRWGYEQRYCYELINLKDVDHRSYIEETPAKIYEFEVHKDRINFEIYEDEGDKISWQHAQAYIY